MNASDVWPLLPRLLAAAPFLVVVVQAVRQRTGLERDAALLSAYALLAALLQVAQALLAGTPSLAQAVAWTGAFGLMALLHFQARAFVRARGGELWAVVAALWAVGLAGLAFLPGLPETLAFPPYRIARAQLTLTVALGGWAIFLLATLILLRRAYLRLRQPLHRNRLTYWLPVLLLLVLQDALVFLGRPDLYGLPRLAGAALLAFAVLTHHLPDVRQIVRRALIYLITTLLVVFFYLLATLLSQIIFPAGSSRANPLVVGAVIALALALLFPALLVMVQRAVNRAFLVDEYDPGQALHRYGESISNILDIHRLAGVAVGLIMEVMDVERGFLFLVDRETGAEGNVTYLLRAVRSADGERELSARLSADSPIARSLVDQQRPLMQYDLDLLPVFRQAPAAERQWFARLGCDVYVPIFAKREWIGLLALGGKLSGTRYTDQDLATLSALANQTAAALENARLVDNLMRLNQELRLASRALDKANRDLERLDRTKSDFISIASHELRTPLTAVRGYVEMLLEDPVIRGNPFHLKIMRGIHDGTLRLHEIMDSLFAVAQIDTRTLQLHLQETDTAALVRDACAELARSVGEREQTLTLDLPPLPLLRADPNILQKVFHHLVVNAIKFTPNGGRIRVHGRAVAPTSEMPDGAVQITVSDTGIGVHPEYREIIFTKFYQPEEQLDRHSSSKSRFRGGGAGLGLALSRGIVEAHGGRIWVESPGYDEVNFPGSDFHVLLPLPKREPGQPVKLGQAVKMTI